MIEIAEITFSASFISGNNKLVLLENVSTKLDSVKFLLRLAWEIKALDNKKYIALSRIVNDIGKMLGGWLKQLHQ